MDATIAAALISGGVGALGIAGTVVTSMVGSRNAREATRATVEAGSEANRATLVAAREDRLWERRAASYQAMLTALLHRQAQRNYELRTFRPENESEDDLLTFYRNYQLPAMFETEAALTAYSSEAVLAAHRASRNANGTVQNRVAQRDFIHEQIQSGERSGEELDADGVYETMAVEQDLDRALRAADKADRRLIDLIRDELRKEPEAAIPPAEVPAEPRWLWRRTLG